MFHTTSELTPALLTADTFLVGTARLLLRLAVMLFLAYLLLLVGAVLVRAVVRPAAPEPAASPPVPVPRPAARR
jgi:hypothetical protein